MRALTSTFSAEWSRLFRSRSTWFAGIAISVVAFLRVSAVHVTERAAWAQQLQRALLQGNEPPDAPPISNAFGPWVDGLRAGIALGVILLIVHGARSLATDDERGIARIQLTRGASRSSLVLVRGALGFVLVPLLVLLSGLGALFAATLFFRFEALVQEGYELASLDLLFEESRIAILAALPPLIASHSFAIMISARARSSALALVLALVVLLGFDLFKEVLGESQYWLFAAYTPSFVDHSCLKEMSGIARGFFDSGYTDALIRMNFTLPLAQAALFIVIALLLYRRRPL